MATIYFIKDELIKRNWSHAELSRRCGISQAHISRVLNSDYQPGLDFYTSISIVFDFPLELVFIKAGVLNEESPDEPKRKNMIYLFNKLNDRNKNLIMAFAEILIENYR